MAPYYADYVYTHRFIGAAETGFEQGGLTPMPPSGAASVYFRKHMTPSAQKYMQLMTATKSYLIVVSCFLVAIFTEHK